MPYNLHLENSASQSLRLTHVSDFQNDKYFDIRIWKIVQVSL